MHACAGRWALAALEWLTVQLDLEAESAELHSAMQASLTEEQQRKSAEVPLEQRPPEALAEQFNASFLLPKVLVCEKRCPCLALRLLGGPRALLQPCRLLPVVQAQRQIWLAWLQGLRAMRRCLKRPRQSGM